MTDREKIARALCNIERGLRPNLVPWEEQAKWNQDHYYYNADVILKALHE